MLQAAVGAYSAYKTVRTLHKGYQAGQRLYDRLPVNTDPLSFGRAKARRIEQSYGPVFGPNLPNQVAIRYKHSSLMPREKGYYKSAYGPGYKKKDPRPRKRTTRYARKARMNPRFGGFVGLERKFLDTTRSVAVMSTSWAAVAPTPAAGSTNSLSAMAQGNGQSEHIGRTYNIRSIQMRFTLSIPVAESETAPHSQEFYRLVVVLDTQCNNTAITATEVMQTSAVSDLQSYLNLENTGRFVILWDSGPTRIIPQNMNEGSINLFAHGQVNQFRQMYHKFRTPVKVRTSGTAANVTSITDNNIMCIGITTESALTCQFISRCRYTE